MRRAELFVSRPGEGIGSFIRAAERAHDVANDLGMRLTDASARDAQEAIKGCASLNGGAAVAILAFIAGIVGRGNSNVTLSELRSVSNSLFWFAGDRCDCGISYCSDQIDLAADEVGGQCRQPIIVALRPAIFDSQVLSLDVAGFAQSLTEPGEARQCRAFGRPWVKVTDDWHRLLLRADQVWVPCRTGENGQEIAAPHGQLPDMAQGWIMAQ